MNIDLEICPSANRANRADVVIVDPNHSPHSSSDNNTIIDELTDHEMRKKMKDHITETELRNSTSIHLHEAGSEVAKLYIPSTLVHSLFHT